MDIFAGGCFLCLVLTKKHPFGDGDIDIWKIEDNIRAGKYNIYLPESEASMINLISHMISMSADNRPSASAVLMHPAFWGGHKTEDFIMQVTKWLQKVENFDQASEEIENNKHFVMGSDWTNRVPKEIMRDLKKFCKPKGSSLYMLLRKGLKTILENRRGEGLTRSPPISTNKKLSTFF